MKKKKNKRGRKTKITPQIITLVKYMARSGMTDKQIAKDLRIAESTLYKWKKDFPEFSEALKEGKNYIDAAVEESLLRRALGFDYEESTIEINKVEPDPEYPPPEPDPDDPEDSEIPDKKKKNGIHLQNKKIKKVKKHIIPDTTAATFWLVNRQPAKWRNKQEISHIGSGENGEEIESLLEGDPESRELLKQLYRHKNKLESTRKD